MRSLLGASVHGQVCSTGGYDRAQKEMCVCILRGIHVVGVEFAVFTGRNMLDGAPRGLGTGRFGIQIWQSVERGTHQTPEIWALGDRVYICPPGTHAGRGGRARGARRQRKLSKFGASVFSRIGA